ncbi:hypothetical protein, partial [Actinocorallia lasiicapitis]
MSILVFACATHAVYLVSFILFKLVGRRMERVSPRHPLRAAVVLLGSPAWVASLAVLISGTGLAYLAVGHAPLTLLLASYLIGLPPLLYVATTFFGERLSPREWRAVGLSAFALLAVFVASGAVTRHGLTMPPHLDHVTADPSLWRLAAVLVPSLGLPIWMFCLRERKTDSRHGRPLTGVAYGIGAGVLLGTAEAFGLGIPAVIADDPARLASTPYLVVFLAAGGLGLGLLTISFQQCRLVMISMSVNVVGKAQLLVAATILYGEPWPSDPLRLALQLIGLGLLALAMMSLPTFERSSAYPRAPRPEPQPRPLPAAQPH